MLFRSLALVSLLALTACAGASTPGETASRRCFPASTEDIMGLDNDDYVGRQLICSPTRLRPSAKAWYWERYPEAFGGPPPTAAQTFD